jgi:DNA-binding MarR family transcriptional regulator
VFESTKHRERIHESFEAIVTNLQWHCLALIRCLGPITMKEMQQRLGTGSDVVLAIDDLATLGFVTMVSEGNNWILDVTLRGRTKFNRRLKK